MKKRGLFITFEGTDGVGKSTQIAMLRTWAQQHKLQTVVTREPGGGQVAEKIREILLHPGHHIEDLTELFLYQAARVEHVEKVIKPALKQKKIVLCDRFTDSTLAYQGAGRKLMSAAVMLNEIATGGIKPDLTILLSLPPRIALGKARKKTASQGGDRLENAGLAFQKKVSAAFKQIAREHPRRVKVVAVQKEKEATQKMIQKHAAHLIYGNSRTA